jgi:hypothetical protein
LSVYAARVVSGVRRQQTQGSVGCPVASRPIAAYVLTDDTKDSRRVVGRI